VCGPARGPKPPQLNTSKVLKGTSVRPRLRPAVAVVHRHHRSVAALVHGEVPPVFHARPQARGAGSHASSVSISPDSVFEVYIRVRQSDGKSLFETKRSDQRGEMAGS